MANSFIKLVVGDLDEKKAYYKFKKRVAALPKDYRFAYKKIQQYLNYVDLSGCDMKMYTDLVELFEESAAHDKAILEVIGEDVATFCDELVHASEKKHATSKEKFNREILEHFHRKVK